MSASFVKQVHLIMKNGAGFQSNDQCIKTDVQMEAYDANTITLSATGLIIVENKHICFVMCFCYCTDCCLGYFGLKMFLFIGGKCTTFPQHINVP